MADTTRFQLTTAWTKISDADIIGSAFVEDGEVELTEADVSPTGDTPIAAHMFKNWNQVFHPSSDLYARSVGASADITWSVKGVTA